MDLRSVATNIVSSIETKPTLFRRIWPVLKWLLFALAIAFIGRRAWLLWRDGDVGSVTIHWPWLLAAFGTYGIGWLPSVLYWYRLIHQFGGTTGRWDVAHAFFAGHLGKYIPGKASVLLIRAGMLVERGCRPGVAALTSTYETLTYMGVGLAVGLTLAPVVWRHMVTDLPDVIRPAFERPLAFGVAVVVVCVVLVPGVAKVLGLIARKLTPPVVPAGEVETRQAVPEIEIRASFLLGWSFVFVTAWLAHGLSLGCTLRAVGVEASLSDWLIWTGDVWTASFLGFVAVFTPGGLGVREAALIELLKVQPGISSSQAVAAAVLLRGAWLATEIVVTLGLGWEVRRRRKLQFAMPDPL
ncbi:MAG: flippase-like domain-containing protein [Planctomycetaceae bacterium]|nr:flippase-like domain-containing protein [Planctomycetaceae bacterium]